MSDPIDDLYRKQRSGAITADSISDELTAELVQELDLGDWELDDWSAQFIESNLQRTSFSPKQKAVIYKLAKRFNLL